MPDLTPAERAVVDALIGYTEVDQDAVDDVDRAEILRLARLVLAAARPHIAAERRTTGECPGCPCGWNGPHPADSAERSTWMRLA